ncbi:uncharacterized protein LOC132302453 [Cornus florida]|uniref:uncharacterized protein LOC132302453 n=1 Tax=Cornus florida TaxID=4283 RepID=UPI002898AB09|nr:uncharacterized protein LOC132302453 [Cornus florida]
MDGTIPIRPSAIPKLSAPGEVDENDLNNDKMGSKWQNPKKPSTKHFMSPTISAASKAVAQKMKILAERNEAPTFSETQIDNSSKLDFTTIPVNPKIGRSRRSSSSQITPLYNSVSESDEDEQNTFVAQSSLKPYDPLTNYLSPRPKFLRYKPNRRHQIFLGSKNEIREEKDGFDEGRSALFDSQKAMDDEELFLGDPHRFSAASSSQEGSVKQEEERINQSDDFDSDEEMEEFEEKGSILKGFLKSLLVFVLLFLSTLYISSMNSPTPSPTLQAIRGLQDDYVKIQNRIFEAVTKKAQVGSVEAVNQSEDVYDEKSETEPETEVEYDHELDDNSGSFNQLMGTETDESEAVYDEKPEDACECSDQLQGTDIVESEDVSDHELMNLVESFHKFQGIELGKNPEAYEDFQAPFTAPSVESNSAYDQVEPVDGIISDVVSAGKEEVDEDELKRLEDITNTASDEIVTPERIDSETTKSDATNPEVERFFEGLKTDLFPEAVIGFVMILTSFVLGFHLRRKRTSAKNALVMGRMLSESAIAKKISPVLPHMEEGHIEKVVPSANPSSWIRSMDESLKESYQSRAPSVELLTEFEVGEVSSSLRSCGLKSKMMDNEESNYSVSQEKGGSWSKDRAVSGQLASPLSEFSTMDSPSYGSFTAEKKMAKKEEGKDGEVRMVVTTPVRRSTRIRNRSVMSP